MRPARSWNYRELRERIADGCTLRQFTDSYCLPVPRHDAFNRGFNRLTPKTLKAINDLVVQAAVGFGLEDGQKLRVDTTVVQTDIHQPTEAVRDEGGAFGFGNQVLISSNRKLLRSKIVVMSVAETPGRDSGGRGRERRAQANRGRGVESGLGDGGFGRIKTANGPLDRAPCSASKVSSH
jgi:hypothetical protein